MTTGNQNRKSTSFRLTSPALVLMTKMSKKLGVSKTAVVELALRRLADLELDKKRSKST